MLVIANLQSKNMPKENAPCKSLSLKIAKFCYQSKEKVLSSNTFGIMQICTEKDKNGEAY